MSTKVILVFCVEVLFAHVVFSQCIQSGVENRRLIAPSVGITPCGSVGTNSLGFGEGFGFGYGLGIGGGISSGFAGAGMGSAGYASGGGAFPIESLAPIAPNGIVVSSDNVYEGALGVVGELPFLSTVALEGVLPSAGAGIVNHGYGNGITAITSEIDNSAGFIGGNGIGGNGIGAGIFGAGGIGAGFGSGIVGAGGIGSGIIGAGGVGSGIIGSGIGSGAIGYGLGGIGSGIGSNAGRGCGCGW